jgi:hypothetical protein
VGKISILLSALKSVGRPKVFINAEDFVLGEKGFALNEFVAKYVNEAVYQVLSTRKGLKATMERLFLQAKGQVKLLRDVLGAVKVTLNVHEVSSTIEVLLDKVEKGKRIDEESSQALDIPEVLAGSFG